MNYGEEITYWYLRLNGFFPLTNFVIHRVDDNAHPSDVDILAIRPEHVYEEIGGKPEDWDNSLLEVMDFRETIGLICEVKTGRFERAKLFKSNHVKYAMGRLGLVPENEIDEVSKRLKEGYFVKLNHNASIYKLLICDKELDTRLFLSMRLIDLEGFIEDRIRKYPEHKYADRMYFCSELFQHMIHRINEERKARGN